MPCSCTTHPRSARLGPPDSGSFSLPRGPSWPCSTSLFLEALNHHLFVDRNGFSDSRATIAHFHAVYVPTLPMATIEPQLPPSPGRGRSRFSKALPVTPAPKALGLSSTLQTKYSSSSTTTTMSEPRFAPLPALPPDALPPKRSLPRRPIASKPSPEKVLSRKSSSSSVYSDKPGLPGDDFDGGDNGRYRESVSADDILGFYGDAEQTSPQTSPRNTLLSSPSGLQKSPPRPEIWRRRSQKSDKDLSVAELKLENSNGSTASPPSIKPPVDRALPPVPFELPRSKASTGRKPVPLRPAPPQPTTMGNNLAKLKKKLSSNALAGAFIKQDSPVQPDEDTTKVTQPFTLPPLNRSPTPEADKMDGKTEGASIPQTLSPALPHTPPEDATPLVPQKSRARKPLGEATMFSGFRNKSDLTINSSSEASTVTIKPTIEAPPSLPDLDLAAISAAPDAPLPPLPSQEAKLSTPPITSPPPQAKFPRTSPKTSPGTSIPAPALDVVHFECYQNHKMMRSSQNKVCPVACMVCQKTNPDTHWKCDWCCLRCCKNCMQVLSSVPGKDLRVCLEQVSAGGKA